MKAKLLKKCRKIVKIQKRNKWYFITNSNFDVEVRFKTTFLHTALKDYRRELLDFAKQEFGTKFKKRIR